MLTVNRLRRYDGLFGPPLCWILTLWHRLKRDAGQRAEVRRIVVILLSEMGAVVLARPMFDRLREKYEGARILVLCSEKNRGAIELLDLVPSTDHVIAVRSGSLREIAVDSFRAIRRLRAFDADVVVDAELFSRVSACFSGLSGAPIRVGFHRYTQEGLYRGDFINRPVLYNPYEHIAHQFVTLAEAVDSTNVPTVKRLVPLEQPIVPQMALGSNELESARQQLHRAFPTAVGRQLVFLSPSGGLLPLRAWPLEYYGRIARELTRRGFCVGVVGLPEDRALAASIQAACVNDLCLDLTGYTSTVRDIAVLMHLGALLITNDGGTAHFASVTPIRTIVLYGPETPVLYGSLSRHAVNLHKPLSCSPCLTAYNHRQSPCDGDNVCLKSISPEEVLAAAYALLDISIARGSEEMPTLQQ